MATNKLVKAIEQRIPILTEAEFETFIPNDMQIGETFYATPDFNTCLAAYLSTLVRGLGSDDERSLSLLRGTRDGFELDIWDWEAYQPGRCPTCTEAVRELNKRRNGLGQCPHCKAFIFWAGCKALGEAPYLTPDMLPKKSTTSRASTESSRTFDNSALESFLADLTSDSPESNEPSNVGDEQ